ncbi:MAG: tetratricopeptide repeat protein [Nitrospirae bacterium]|nr:MAG: tetratricopeptide repeat protein [Nitrospirota bacterium]
MRSPSRVSSSPCRVRGFLLFSDRVALVRFHVMNPRTLTQPSGTRMSRIARSDLHGVLLVACWIGFSACATDPDISELHKQIQTLQTTQASMLQREQTVMERLTEIESKLDEHDFLVGELIKTEEESNLDTRHLLDKLERMHARLREQIDQTREATQRRDRDLSIRVKALESRLENLVHGKTPVMPPNVPTRSSPDDRTSQGPHTEPPSRSPARQEEETAKPLNQAALFRSAYKAYLGGQYERATLEFTRFVKRFPTAALTPQAYYYLGDAHYTLKHYKEATLALQHVIEAFPDNHYVPPALYKLGLVMASSNQPERAQQFWTRILEEYPDSPEAEFAKDQLAKLSESS